MAAHRYWRLYITENAGNPSYLTTFEIELRTAIGGADVTGSGTVTASGGNWPSDAFDNNTSSWWQVSPPTYPSWVRYDFGAGNEKDIVEVAIYPSATRGQNPSTFDLQYSDDGASWSTLFSIGNETEWATGVWQSFNATDIPTMNGANTAWRIRVTANNGAAAVAVSEIQMFESGSSVDACSGGKAFANSVHYNGNVYSQNAFNNSFGNSLGDIWVSEETLTSPSPWIGYRFAAAKNIVIVGITARQGTEVSQAPKNFTIDYWDGSAWQTYATLTGVTGWASGQTRYFNASGETTAPVSASAGRPWVFIVT